MEKRNGQVEEAPEEVWSAVSPEMPMAPESAAPAGKAVEIELMADGSFTVSPCEPKGEPMEETEEPTGESYASMDEALQAAAALLTDDTRSEEDQQMAGYSKGAKPAGNKMPINQVFGE